MRGGTENVAGAVGLAVAAEAALSHQAGTARQCEALADLMLATITDAVPATERLGNPERRLPHILSLRLPGITGQTLLERCDARGIAFSTGSACHSRDDNTAKASHVLTAIGLDRKAAREVIRISFSADTTTAQAAAAAQIIAQEAAALRTFAPRAFGEGILDTGADGTDYR